MSYPMTIALFFTPSLPQIVSFFPLTSFQSDWIIAIYLLGYAFGQLPYGPFANRFGRKKALILGLSISIFGCFLCVFSSFIYSFSLFLFARFFQAVGACVGLKISLTMIADTHDEERGVKLVSLLGLSFSIVPAIGIFIGGALTQNDSWQSCFYLLAFWGVLLIFLSLKLKETKPKINQSALFPSEILKGYLLVAKNKSLLFSGLIIGFETMILYFFNAKAPFIGIENLKMNPKTFGIYSMIPLSGMLIGSLISNKIAGTKHLFQWIFGGGILTLFASFVMFVSFYANQGSVYTFFFPMFLIFMFDSIVFSNISFFGLARERNKAYASAVLNFLSFGIPGFFMTGLNFISLSVERLMPLLFILLTILILVITWILRAYVQSLEASPSSYRPLKMK